MSNKKAIQRVSLTPEERLTVINLARVHEAKGKDGFRHAYLVSELERILDLDDAEAQVAAAELQHRKAVEDWELHGIGLPPVRQDCGAAREFVLPATVALYARAAIEEMPVMRGPQRVIVTAATAFRCDISGFDSVELNLNELPDGIEFEDSEAFAAPASTQNNGAGD